MDNVIPSGITPIYLTRTTVGMFQLTDLTEENLFKRVSLKELLADIQFRGKTSDWEPAKHILLAYKDGDKPPEELQVLVVLDPSNEYDQNFYLCNDEESAAAVIAKIHPSNQIESAETMSLEEALSAIRINDPGAATSLRSWGVCSASALRALARSTVETMEKEHGLKRVAARKILIALEEWENGRARGA